MTKRRFLYHSALFLVVIAGAICYLQLWLGRSLGQIRPQTKVNVSSHKNTGRVPIALNLGHLPAETSIASLIQDLTNENGGLPMSIRNVTCEAFVANNTCASNEQFASFLDLEEIMSEVWTRQAPVLNKRELGSTRIIWLVDLVGDSFNRGQYLVLAKYLAGLRTFPDDTFWATN